MDKIATYLEELLIFMANDIAQKGSSLNNTRFYFSFSDNKRYLKNNEGEDLQSFKKLYNLTDDELIQNILMKALEESYIQRGYINGKAFDNITLTEKGFQKSKKTRLLKKVSA